MLREVIEDALQRGERLKKDIVGQVLSSAALSELINNKKFTDTVAKIIETKDEIAKTLRRRVEDVLKMMRIPSCQDITSYHRRVEKLENQIEQIGHHLKKISRKTPAKKKSKRK
ncbi:MAG: phasin family protein [Deltaproteobacteria bacterium]|nr:phasin family protein [Deltaproteobacteria bacterium]